MLFNSFVFLIFLLLTFVIYYLPFLEKYQVQVLIIASGVFYGYSQCFLLLLLIFSASINALTSYFVYYNNNYTYRKFWAASGVAANLFVLVFFKYNILIGSSIYGDLSNIEGLGAYFLMLPLPVGISFYTFQGISLVVDVFRSSNQDHGPAAHTVQIDRSFLLHFKKTFFYIVFFPQLVAGPIVKAYEFLPQIKRKFLNQIEWNFVFKNLILGYFLKIVIADNLKDQTFFIAYPFFQGYSSLNLVTFLFGFSVQIFSDFAGYSFIAIGVAALFGYKLPQNFNFPYISKSFSEFWRRWHISLSSWLKEYLYIALGGNRKGKVMTYVNLFLVMFFGGLWHGAAWGYAVWGMWHGVALTVERFFSRKKNKTDGFILQFAKICFVFLFVSFAWPLFKLPELKQAIMYFQAIYENVRLQPNITIIISIIFFSIPIAIFHIYYLIKQKYKFKYFRALEYFAYGGMLFLLTVSNGSPGEFIYFQF